MGDGITTLSIVSLDSWYHCNLPKKEFRFQWSVVEKQCHLIEGSCHPSLTTRLNLTSHRQLWWEFRGTGGDGMWWGAGLDRRLWLESQEGRWGLRSHKRALVPGELAESQGSF